MMLSNWSIPRFLQLLAGIYFVWNFVEDRILFFLLFGALMLFQAIMNIGCFSTKDCNTSYNNDLDSSNDATIDEVDYEEME